MDNFFKKTTALFLAALMLTACASSDKGEKKTASSKGEGAVTSKTDTTKEFPQVESCKNDDENFRVYTSNTYVSTGCNGLSKALTDTTYRAYFPLEEYGELEYRFFFSNTVDSTYNKGKPVYVGKEGGEYQVISANLYDGGDDENDEPVLLSKVTFDGSEGKTVKPNETFWSDPVTIDVPEGHFLVWEWTLNGRDIPSTEMSNLTKAVAKAQGKEEFSYCSAMPQPVLIGAKRDKVENRVVLIGDSITQGCQTEYMKYEFWGAGIAQGLSERYSLWNCGLGWARSSDLATCGSWLSRALNCDTAVIAFGTNDITSGDLNGDGKGDSADEIIGYITDILAQYHAAGVENIIVFNAPPQDYKENKEAVRVEYNQMLRQLCEDYGVEYFDFASYLCDEATPDKAKYGGHPNGEAGAIVAKAFLEKYDYLTK
ncbi:MAG: SGNH/GDSL hydrolase family protein [Ruminococcus sp.]|nr:SGNH/GDSL hydrolase family protein [Ruminococcus sp.]